MIVSGSSRFPRRKIVLALLDGVLTFGALVIAIFLRLSQGGYEAGWAYIEGHQLGIFVTWAAFMVAFYLGGLYESDRLTRIGSTLTSATIAVALGAVISAAIYYATLAVEERHLGRGIFFGSTVFVFCGVVAVRLLYVMATRRGLMAQRCLVIGTGEEASKIVDLLDENPDSGMRLLGLIAVNGDRDKIGKFVGDFPVLGHLDSLEKFVDLYGIERLIIAAPLGTEPVLLRRLRAFRYRGLSLVDFVTLHEELADEIPLDYIDDEWLFHASLNNSRFHIRRMKRLLDIIASLVGLVLSAPISLIAAILIRLDSRGPVLFRQERLGRDSIPFTVMKFRTMRVDAESETGPVWATEDDPRITRVGKWLRKFRIDELPQLVNVLRGEMSLVGPRPEREVFIRKLSEQVPYYAERLLVPPGITGWAQVMAPYAASVEDSRRKLQFDLYYIKHMSFFLDMYVMVKTIKTIIFGRERTPRKKTRRASRPKPVEIKTETYFFSHPAGKSVTPAPAVRQDDPVAKQKPKFG